MKTIKTKILNFKVISGSLSPQGLPKLKEATTASKAPINNLPFISIDSPTGVIAVKMPLRNPVTGKLKTNAIIVAITECPLYFLLKNLIL